jgi:hypothetical protein
VPPIPIPDGRFRASSSAVGRGMGGVDGSTHYIGCRHFWGWGGSAPGVGLAGSLTKLIELKCGLFKCWLAPFLSLRASTCRVCASGT